MKTKDILNGIQEALTRQELSAHIDLIESAIIREECDYGVDDWLTISRAIDKRNTEINNRIYH